MAAGVAGGGGFTVRVFKDETGLLQPVFTVYIISVVPVPVTVTKPLTAFTVATSVLLLLQVPPGLPLLK